MNKENNEDKNFQEVLDEIDFRGVSIIGLKIGDRIEFRIPFPKSSLSKKLGYDYHCFYKRKDKNYRLKIFQANIEDDDNIIYILLNVDLLSIYGYLDLRKKFSSKDG